MPQSAKQIAAIFDELSFLLELKGDNSFKIRAHQQAAELIAGLNGDISEAVARAERGEIAGIGKVLGLQVREIYETGTTADREALRSEYPDSLLQLRKVHGIGPKKIKALFAELGIATLDALEAGCESGAVAKLKGFGAKTQATILSALSTLKHYGRFRRYPQAKIAAEELRALITDLGICESVEISGELRRCLEVTGSLDLLAVGLEADAASVLATALGVPVADESGTLTFTLAGSISLKLIASDGTAEQLFAATGPIEHVEAVMARPAAAGVVADDEFALYASRGLAFIPPEFRDHRHSIKRAQAAFEADEAALELVEGPDLRGILHVHSTYSDGKNTVRELAEAAIARGFEYLGLTDHSQSAAYAGGLREEAIRRQHDEVDRLNIELAPFRIFKGIESDILADGALDYPDAVLDSFDFIIGSVHSRFSLAPAEMTARVVRAVRHPRLTILGHPTGRLLLSRESYGIDLDAVLDAAAERGVAIEINANPYRLELDWRLLPRAQSLGIPIPICPDAHSIEGFADIEFGVAIARKGGLTAADVLNCRTRDEIAEYFRARRETA